MEDTLLQHPDLPLFKMPRQHKQGYWSFVMLVAPSAHLPAGKTKWESSDAEMAYCTKCNVTFKYKSGSSAAIRQHLGQKHPKVLAESQSNMKRKDASKLVKDAIASKRKSCTVFLSPTKKSKKVNSAEEAMATRLLTDWISKCLRPLGITEDKELRFFTTFIQTINGIYELPSRRTITERLQTHASQRRTEVKDEIFECALFYSLTTDIWTSRTTESFLALTIHFVTEAFKLMTYTLEVVSFPGRHSGTRIANLIRNLMEKWGLDFSRLTKIIRDNGSNVVKACNDLEVDHFGCVAHSLHLVVSGALSKTREEVEAAHPDEQISFGDRAEPDDIEEQWAEDPEAELEAIGELEAELGHITLGVTSSVESDDESVDLETDDCMDEGLLDGCLSARAAVGLMNTMKKAMSETRKHVASFRKIVTFFNKSAKGKAKLKELQKVPLPLTVIADVATRWNSTHQMIERLLVLRPILQEFMEYIQTSVGKDEFSDVKIARPTGEMWFHIQCLDKLLVSFHGMTTLLSGEKYATMPLIRPSLAVLMTRLRNKKIFSKVSAAHEGELYYVATLKRLHLVRRFFLLLLRKRFGNLPDDVNSCCLLDPQFAHGSYLSVTEREEAERFLVNEALRLAGADVIDANLNSSVEMSSDDDGDFMSELLGLNRKPTPPEPESPEELSLREQVKTELNLYFEKCKLRDKTKLIRARENPKPKNQNKLENPLKWWKDNAGDFPFMARVVRKYFGIVATSVPSERCFSCAGNTITARRNRLSGPNVRDIIFLHNNMADDEDSTDEEYG